MVPAGPSYLKVRMPTARFVQAMWELEQSWARLSASQQGLSSNSKEIPASSEGDSPVVIGGEEGLEEPVYFV